jgi:hypothetical protein
MSVHRRDAMIAGSARPADEHVQSRRIAPDKVTQYHGHDQQEKPGPLVSLAIPEVCEMQPSWTWAKRERLSCFSVLTIVRRRFASLTVAESVRVEGKRTKEGTMSLEEKLAAVREASAKRIPPERLSVMHAATQQLRRSGILDHVIKPGTLAPDFTLNDQNGLPVRLSTLAERGPVLMSVFRGFW